MTKKAIKKKNRRGEITLQILESLANVAMGSVDLFLAFLNAGYGASYGKFEYELSKIRRERARTELERRSRGEKEQPERLIRERYHSFMYKLKRDGLVKENAGSQRGAKQIFITSKGRRKLVSLQKQRVAVLPEVTYPNVKGKTLIIVTFDVPEEERRKRDWLRTVLKRIGFTMVQKSVWIGKMQLPEAFIKDLKTMHLVGCVEIFSVTRTGSLRRFG